MRPTFTALKPVLLLTATLYLAGCSQQQWQESGQSMAEDACYDIRNHEERQQCFDDVQRNYP